VLGFNEDAGQVAVTPVQITSFSQGPEAVEHTVELELNVARGQELELPVQLTSFSQGPEAVQHTVELDLNVAVGQELELPDTSTIIFTCTYSNLYNYYNQRKANQHKQPKNFNTSVR